MRSSVSILGLEIGIVGDNLLDRLVHDAVLCDLIACWHDNRPDCPIEVLELATALAAPGPATAQPRKPAAAQTAPG